MAESVVPLIGIIVIGYVLKRLWDETQGSLVAEGLLKKKINTVMDGWADTANEQIDPTTIRADPTSHPVIYSETGPFGIPREIRSDNGSNFTFPTFGDGSYSFFDQL